MILNFKREIGGNPTYFAERIYKAMLWDKEQISAFADELTEQNTRLVKFDKDKSFDLPAKLHTIRLDKANRWRMGTVIHPYYGARTKKAVQFAPVMRCESVQKIKIDNWSVQVDGYDLSNVEIDVLAENDGFDSKEAFLNFFSQGFEGKLIHFTDLKYPLLFKDRRHSHYWIEDGILCESYHTIRGLRFRHITKVPSFKASEHLENEYTYDEQLGLLRYLTLLKKRGDYHEQK